MREKNATTPQKALSSSKIVEIVTPTFIDRLTHNSMMNYLGHAARKDNSSGVTSAGRSKGYYLNEGAEKLVAEIVAEEEQLGKPEEEARKRRVFREKSLYPIIEGWLKQEDYQSRIVADGRAGGKWSNPDVVGIRVSSNFGLTDIEIVSIEVKIGLSNWRQDIFEAISHKRFANRVYFAIPVIDGIDKLDPELSRYCEMYKIGLIYVYTDESNMQKLLHGKNDKDLPLISDVDAVDDRIPAPYEFIPPRYQIEFLKQIGINEQKDLYLFGAI